eukprot:g897.t1
MGSGGDGFCGISGGAPILGDLLSGIEDEDGRGDELGMNLFAALADDLGLDSADGGDGAENAGPLTLNFVAPDNWCLDPKRNALRGAIRSAIQKEGGDSDIGEWSITAKTNRACRVKCAGCVPDREANKTGDPLCTFVFKGMINKTAGAVTELKAHGSHGVPRDPSKSGMRRMATEITRQKVGVTAQTIQYSIYEKTGRMGDLSLIKCAKSAALDASAIKCATLLPIKRDEANTFRQAVKDARHGGVGTKKNKNYEDFARIAKNRKVRGGFFLLVFLLSSPVAGS